MNTGREEKNPSPAKPRSEGFEQARRAAPHSERKSSGVPLKAGLIQVQRINHRIPVYHPQRPFASFLNFSRFYNNLRHEILTDHLLAKQPTTMDRTEKKYFRLECPIENITFLTESFDPMDFFQISLYNQPGIHYFIFTRDAELVISRGYARVNHFPYSVMTRDEFLRINPESGHYIQKGLPGLSPWVGKLIPGTPEITD